MNLLKIGRYLANNQIINNRFEFNLIKTLNKKTLFTIKTDLKCNKLLVLSQKSTLFGNNSLNINNNDRNGFDLSHNLVIIRCSAKGRDKPRTKSKGGKPKVMLSAEEMQQIIPFAELNEELNKVIQRLKDDFVANINIRSNPSAIENLLVEIDGSKFSLSEIAHISRKSAQLVVINLSSMPDALKPVMTAINESGMNLSPQQEGTIIYLPIPKVTREHREILAKNAKVMCQRAKDELKDIHSSFSSYVKKQKKGHVSEELIFNVNENLKYLIDFKIAECDELLDHKINDLLK